MWGQIIATIAGAVIGGVVNGVSAYNTSVKNANEYAQAAQQVKDAANKYSGKEGYNKIKDEGINEAVQFGQAAGNEMAAEEFVPQGPGATGAGATSNAYNKSNQVAGATNSAARAGLEQGMSRQQARNEALYNANTVLAQQKMKQSDIDTAAANQAVQEGMNAISNGANLYNSLRRSNKNNNITSDERLKDDAQASVEDALRQIDSINYKYKPETGLDQDEHVGITAQSVEGTALDNGMVSEDENGYKQLDKQKLMESIFAAQAALQKQIDALKEDDGKFTSDENCKNIEKKIESNPQKAAASLPQGSPIQKEAVQAAQGGKDAEVNNQVVDDWYTTQKKKWPQIDNRTLSALWNRDFGMKEPSKESYDAYASTISDERPNGISLPINKFLDYPSIYKSGKGYDEYMKEQRSGLSDEEFESHKANIDDMLSDFQRNYENGSITLSEAVDTIKQLPDDDVYKDDSGMTPRKKAINSIVFDMVYNNESGVRKYFEKLANIYSIRPELFEPYTVSQAQHTEGIFNSLSYVIGLLIDKEQQNNTSKVDPVTAAMNAGLSEDDDDYFTSDKRCKDIEKKIESNPVEAAQALPQGSDIQKEAVQAIDGGQDAEVNNQVIDAYTKELQNAYGDKFAAYKQNDYMKQMPQDVTLDNLAESDWFKNARKQVGPEYISGNFTYGRQPGFDIDEEWIKANDPNAYKTYGFNDNEGIDDYDKWGDYRNDHINRDAKDFADFMNEHPELNYSDVMSAYGDRYKKATGKDFPMEEFRGYSDKHSEDLNIKKFDKELYNTAKEALGENDHFSDKDWDNIKDDIISYIEQTGKIPGFNPYDAGSNDRVAMELFDKICEEYGSNDWYIGKKIKEAADKRSSELENVDMSKFTSDKRCKNIEKKIESGKELSENAPEELKKEAEQLKDNDKRNDEVNNKEVEKAAKKIGSFMVDIPTKEVSQQEYNDMSLDDIEKMDAEAMKGEGDYLTVATDLGLDENDLRYFEDPTFVQNLTEEQKEEVKNEPDKKKKLDLLSKFTMPVASAPDVLTSSVNSEESIPTSEGENVTSGVNPQNPTFSGGGAGAGAGSVTGNIGYTKPEEAALADIAHSTENNVNTEVSERDVGAEQTNSANINKHLDNTFDNLEFNSDKKGDINSKGQFELDGTEGHTSDSNVHLQLPNLNSADDVKEAIIEDSKNWSGNNSGSKFLPFRFSVVGDEVVVSKIGTARKEDFDTFAKDEPGSVEQIKNILIK